MLIKVLLEFLDVAKVRGLCASGSIYKKIRLQIAQKVKRCIKKCSKVEKKKKQM